MSDLITATIALTDVELKQLNQEIYRKADRLTEPLLVVMFLFGLFISFFYDTWFIAIGIGGINVLMYYAAKKLLPNNNLYQYVFSAEGAIFTAQYIYQLHGMAEMHFWVFISSAALIIYQNWRLQLPLIIIVIIHHGTFAYLQYIGVPQIYFTELEYMPLTTFLFHGALASCVCVVAGAWGYNLYRQTVKMESMNQQLHANNEEIQQKNEELRASEEELISSSEELKQINDNLNKIVIERTDALLKQNNTLVQHAHVSAHNVRAPLARILGLTNLMQLESKLDEETRSHLQRLATEAKELDKVLRDVRTSLDKAEFKNSDKVIL